MMALSTVAARVLIRSSGTRTDVVPTIQRSDGNPQSDPRCVPYAPVMQLLGICFAGTSTPQRASMSAFLGDVLGLSPRTVDGVEADLFGLPDGSSFAVASPGGMGESARSLGFLVASLDQAIADLQAAGVATDAPAANGRERYVHFTAPDGHLYELVERIAP
jgi:catechol 2,3-dioxygenase-like lactoylglutathione lyase family enzyme